MGTKNHVKQQRLGRGWSQQELAEKSALPRSTISAVETGRVIPSVAVAIAIASVLDCRVEDLFLASRPEDGQPKWAADPGKDRRRFWAARVGPDTVLYPAEETSAGTLPHDGVLKPDGLEWHDRRSAERTLVIAGCDPATGILIAQAAHTAGLRIIPLLRFSQQALTLLQQGLVHGAGIHLGSLDQNRQAVRQTLGSRHRLLQLSCWEEGIALARNLGIDSVKSALKAKLGWAVREPGSGAGQLLEGLLRQFKWTAGRRQRVAQNHRAVAAVIRDGWAQAGVCVRLAAEEAGLDFIGVRWEDYDLCYGAELEDDRRLKTLLATVRSGTYRRLVGELPGYDTSSTGELRTVR